MSDIAVTREAPTGMLVIRGEVEALRPALAAAGLDVPAPLALAQGEGRSLLWFSPDEMLLLCPRDEVDDLHAAIARAAADTHHTCADMSDARTMFRLSGPGGALRDVLAKLTPADVSPEALPPGRVRRSRLAQVAAAFWMSSDDEARVLVFRSVSDYVHDLLREAAAHPVGHHGAGPAQA